MSIGLILAVLMALTALGFSVDRALGQVRAARRRYMTLLHRRQQQVERIKKVAAASLHLKRELRLIAATATDLRNECETLRDEIVRISRPENRTFILDERRVPQDLVWMALVEAPAATSEGANPPAWSGVRRFLVWAPDESTVRAKVERRYPAERGYRTREVSSNRRDAASGRMSTASVTPQGGGD